jgi:hypothetical protein
VREAAADGLAVTFDSALLLGNNLGLLGSRGSAASSVSDLGGLRPGGVIVGTILGAYQTTYPVPGLPSAQPGSRPDARPADDAGPVREHGARLVRLLAASPAETAELAAAAGWEIARSFPGVSYAAVLRRA